MGGREEKGTMMMVMRDGGLVAPSSDFCLAAPCKDVTHLLTFDLEIYIFWLSTK